jgi:UDP-N-acetylmuramoyl-tripeptide--D-alanyl-D-alanine ligase
MRFTLDEVIRATGGRLEGPPPAVAVQIRGVSTDTRTLRPGDLFVPLRGPRRDGHDYIGEAFTKGAAASLAARHVSHAAGPVIRVGDVLQALARLAGHYRRTLSVRVVGVTGSVGKTTTTAMCAAVLGTVHTVARTKDEWNAEIGVPLTVLALTPETDVAVIEMAMRGLGQITELVEIALPAIGVVTNIGESHRELLGSVENIARAKGELIERLPRDGTAVLNADDDRVMALAALSRAPVLSYGVDRSADVRAEAVVFTPQGMRFRLRRDDGTIDVTLPVWGVHSVSNALAAAAAARVLKVGLEDVRRGLERLEPPKMRLQPVEVGDILMINDAYNASPDSMTAAFDVVRQLAAGRRRVLVLGEMKELGLSGTMHHHGIGIEAAAAADILVTVGDSDAEEIGIAAEGLMPKERIFHVPSTMRAVELLEGILQPGDIVLVKGSRAMEMERVVAGIIEARRPQGHAQA